DEVAGRPIEFRDRQLSDQRGNRRRAVQQARAAKALLDRERSSAPAPAWYILRAEGLTVKKSSFFAGCVAVASLALSGSVLAHHGDAGRYIEDVVEITGTVVETQLINPHAILVLDVTDANGKKVRWQAEM